MRRQLPAVNEHLPSSSAKPITNYAQLSDDELLVSMMAAVKGSGTTSPFTNRYDMPDDELVTLMRAASIHASKQAMAGMSEGPEERALARKASPPVAVAVKQSRVSEGPREGDKIALYQRAAASGSPQDQCW